MGAILAALAEPFLEPSFPLADFAARDGVGAAQQRKPARFDRNPCGSPGRLWQRVSPGR